MPYTLPQSQLEYAVENDKLPDAVVASAKKVLKTLGQPIRIVLLGMPGTDKSAVLNLLLGKTLIPVDLRNLPTLQVEAGPVNQMLCTMPDGGKKIVPGIDLAALAEIKPALVTIKANFPALSKINLMEIVASTDEDQQRKAIAWACKRADIAIWCTTKFNSVEQDLWYDVPDDLKDNSYLLLTKTEDLSGQAEINTRLAEMAKSSGEEFLRIFALSARRALEIRAQESNMDLTAFKATGATTLIAAIMSQIKARQGAAQGAAEQILAKHCDDIDFGSLKEPKTPRLPALDPIPKPVVQETMSPAEQEAVQPPKQEVVQPAKQKAAPAPAAPKQQVAPPPKVEKSIKVGTPLEQALKFVQENQTELIDLLTKEDLPTVKNVLKICETAATEVPEIIGEDSLPPLSYICSAAYEMQNIVVLMQAEKNEKDESRADNAITLLLQLRRDIEAMIVAQGGAV